MPPSNEAVKFQIASLDGSQPSSGTLTVTNVNVGAALSGSRTTTGPRAWRCIITLPEKKRCYGPARENIRDAVEHQLNKFSPRISDGEKQRLLAVASAMQLRRYGTDVKSSEKYETPGMGRKGEAEETPGDIPMHPPGSPGNAKKRKLPSSIPVEHLTAPSGSDSRSGLWRVPSLM